MKGIHVIRAQRDDLADALRDVLGTCAPFSARGGEAVRKAKALLAKLEHHVGKGEDRACDRS